MISATVHSRRSLLRTAAAIGAVYAAPWVPDGVTRRKVFVDNPAILFGFPA
jgi:hypothetical protein